MRSSVPVSNPKKKVGFLLLTALVQRNFLRRIYDNARDNEAIQRQAEVVIKLCAIEIHVLRAFSGERLRREIFSYI